MYLVWQGGNKSTEFRARRIQGCGQGREPNARLAWLHLNMLEEGAERSRSASKCSIEGSTKSVVRSKRI